MYIYFHFDRCNFMTMEYAVNFAFVEQFITYMRDINNTKFNICDQFNL